MKVFFVCINIKFKVPNIALSTLVVLSRPSSVTSPLYDVLDHTYHIFSEISWSKDIKTINQSSYSQMQKYKYTNTQIQHMLKCKKPPTCGIFLKMQNSQ